MSLTIRNSTIEETLVDTSYDEFYESIKGMVADGLTHIEALQEYCETNDIDYETIPSLISPSLMSDLIDEGRNLNLVKGYGRKLPGL